MAEDCSNYGLSNRRPANLLLPPVFIHLLLIDFQQEPSLILTHVECEIRMIRQLRRQLGIDSSFDINSCAWTLWTCYQ
jgi:hypothetical protein